MKCFYKVILLIKYKEKMMFSVKWAFKSLSAMEVFMEYFCD